MNKKERSDNRKALPKFFLTIFLAALGGAVVGIFSSFSGAEELFVQLAESAKTGLQGIAPYSFWVLLIVLGGAEALLYQQAKKLFDTWDGEEESTVELAEEKLSKILLLTSVHLILNLFFMGVFFFLGAEGSLFGLAGFAVSFAVVILMQQKTVDLEKKMNPEKKGSVYDTNFQKKWIESCDENEQRKIGAAAMRSFRMVNNVCVVLWVILVFLSLVYPVGILPMFLVLLIFGVNQVSYCLEAIRLEKKK